MTKFIQFICMLTIGPGNILSVGELDARGVRPNSL